MGDSGDIRLELVARQLNEHPRVKLRHECQRDHRRELRSPGLLEEPDGIPELSEVACDSAHFLIIHALAEALLDRFRIHPALRPWIVCGDSEDSFEDLGKLHCGNSGGRVLLYQARDGADTE